MMIDVIWRSMIDQYLSKCELGLGLKSGLFGKEVFVRGRLTADFTVDRRQRARLHNRHNRNNNVIIIIITNLYSAFRSEDTNALEAAQEDSLRTVIAVSYVQPSPGHASYHGRITTSAIEASMLQAPACGTVYRRSCDET